LGKDLGYDIGGVFLGLVFGVMDPDNRIIYNIGKLFDFSHTVLRNINKSGLILLFL